MVPVLYAPAGRASGERAVSGEKLLPVLGGYLDE